MTPLYVSALRVGGTECPLGTDDPRPRLSWQLRSGEPGQWQTAYRVVVRDRAGVAWDSGRVGSDQSVGVEYEGPPLRSATRYHWRVRVWDARGEPADWSEESWWETGLLDEDDWVASWVGVPDSVYAVAAAPGMPAPCLRRVFVVEEPVASARLYVTALGGYEVRVNGQRVGDDRLTPGWTDYGRRVQYQTYDVTSVLRQGSNAVGALLAPGWFCGRIGFLGDRVYGDRPRFLAQLEVRHADGTRQRVRSDARWRTTAGPVVGTGIYEGEHYDARAWQTGWDQPGFDDAGWQQVVVDRDQRRRLVAQAGPPVRVTRELRATQVAQPVPGVHVFDLGQNMVGWTRLRVRGPAGSRVTLRHGEVLRPDGTVYTDNLLTAEAKDTYVLAGGGADETYEPRFTYHGFRYVEVTGLPGEPTPDTLVGLVAHADLPVRGSLETSSALVNRLQHCLTWSQRGNFLSVPTDCPQRDERLGWTGDIAVFAGTAAFNMDVSGFLGKFARDLVDAQTADGAFTDIAPSVGFDAGNAGWGDAGVVVPWTLWQRYGDTGVVVEHYDAMARWVDYLERTSEPDLTRVVAAYGDWYDVDEPTPPGVVGTAYFARSAGLVADMADAVGRSEDAARYRDLARRVRTAFQTKLVSADGRVEGDSQTGYVLALAFDLLPEQLRRAAADRLVEKIRARDWHLSVGFLGVEKLLPVLTETGHLDVAYRLLNQRSVPSWGHMLDNGATTVWERWDGIRADGTLSDPSANSFNHYVFGSVGDWMYRTIGGIEPDPARPGYGHVRLRPRPGGGITWARASHESPYGTVGCSWRVSGTTMTLDVVVPVNTTATVYVPAGSDDASTRFEVGAGEHTFTAAVRY